MIDSWKCGMCGAKTPAEAEACLVCEPQFNPWRCPGCGASVHASYRRCQACAERRPADWVARKRKASRQSRRAQMQAAGIRYVKVLGSGGECDCPAVRALAGRAVPIESAVDVPLAGCDRKRRCRCVLVATEIPQP